MDYGLEQYLVLIKSRWLRKTVAEFRSGTNKLRIETGRWDGLTRSDRLCPLCGVGVEDEHHVLLVCVKYEDLRSAIFNHFEGRISGSLEDIRNYWLAGEKDVLDWMAVACFIWNIYKRRAFLLSKK